MLHFGITGGIGSGKSTVARIFNILHVPVYNSDQRAKELMRSHPSLVKNIKALFGADAYLEDGSLNRKFIAESAFGNPNILEALNAFVHPAVGQDYLAWRKNQGQSNYTLKEAAILFESGSHENLDGVLVVYAPEKMRIDRVVKRDDVPAERVKLRMAQQWDEKKLLSHGDFILVNDGSQGILEQVLAFHKQVIQFN